MLLKEILEGWGNWARLQFKTLDFSFIEEKTIEKLYELFD